MNDKIADTERLYYKDSHLLRFNARVLSCEQRDEYWAALLDRTAFYPTGGGQPHDVGRIDVANLIDCIDDAAGILHIIDRFVSGEVECEIDSLRRRDHMQQHTGQHILSQAFIKTAGAATRSFHLGAESSTIDVELDEATPEIIRAAEDLANSIVFEDRPVLIHMAGEEEIERFNLRKDTDRQGCVRIIEIEEFDQSPCGGTHARRTGEIGLIAVRSIERVKKRLCRIEFLCGSRALADYRTAHATATATAALFSSARDAAPELVARLQQEHKTLQRRTRELLEAALETEARRLFEAASPDAEGCRLIKSIFPNRDLEEIKLLAHSTVALGAAVVLFAAAGDATRLVFARSQGIAADCGKMMGDFCKRFGGRGGGRPDFAQGGIASGAGIDEALDELASSLRKVGF